MSVAATWSTRATPVVVVMGAAMLALGLLSIMVAALALAHGGAPWGLPAYACLVLTFVLAYLRVRRELHRRPLTLIWDATQGALRNVELADPYQLKKVWRAPGWVTLGVACPQSPGSILYLVVWKSSASSPLWSALALHLEAVVGRLERHQNKENP